MYKYDTREFERKYTYTGNDLGAVYTKEQTTFRVWSPMADAVTLNLYHTGSDAEAGAGMIGQRELQRDVKGTWVTQEAGDLAGVYYTYSISINGKKTETADVYARACGVNGERSMVVDLERTNPQGFLEHREQWRTKRSELVECPVIYELHIKDFSSDPHSGVTEENSGKYLAFTEQGTTCVEWLRSLGITHVHLLPFFDYGSVDESGDLTAQFNWGYDPKNYNVPEGSYSSDPFHGEVRIRECKEMIQALHEAGIAVVMDVVYNHTYSLDSVFQHTAPGYYYRRAKDGSYANGSLCGNDTASERSMFRRYMTDSVCYWAKEYQIDGFRFDLMGLHDTETMNGIREALNEFPQGRDILMYGEPWSGDYSPMRKGAIPADKENVKHLVDGISVFCDKTRDAIKGDVFIEDEPGYVNGALEFATAVEESVCGWCRTEEEDFTPRHPDQIISYVSAHDNFTLWDKLCHTLPENIGKEQEKIDFSGWNKKVLKQNKLAAGIYFTCLGTPFFQAGEEFARTKLGEENSFDKPVELNALDWKRSKEYAELAEFYRGLIAIRREWKEFYGRNMEQPEIEFLDMEEAAGLKSAVAFRMKKHGSRKELFVIYNPTEERGILTLPEGEWKLLCDGVRTWTLGQKRHSVQGEIIVKNQIVMILAQNK